MSLYIKLIDNPTGHVVKPMEILKWGGSRSSSWGAKPEPKILVKIHDVDRDIWIKPDEYKANDYYFFSQRFSGSADKVYEFYHPRYPKTRITISPGGSTRYAARSRSGQTMNVPGGNRIVLRLDPHHLIPFNGRDRFAFGANLAWLDNKYGNDIGQNFFTGWPAILGPRRRNSARYRRNLDEYFRRLKNDFNCRVVRFWVFEGCEGLDFSGGGVRMDPAMAGNIETILNTALQNDLYVYWCLLSTTYINPDYHDAFWKDVEIIRSAVNPRTSPFLNQALRSFCDAISGAPNNFAIDVMNEPEKYIVITDHSLNAHYRKISPGLFSDFPRERVPTSHKAEKGYIQKYIGECCRKIKEYLGQSFLVSCGSGGSAYVNTPVEQTLRNYIGTGLDFYDYHIYNYAGELPKSFDELYGDLELDNPCIIGEFGYKDIDKGSHSYLLSAPQTTRDDFQKGIAKNFLEQSWHLGYGGCLIWNYNFKGFPNNRNQINNHRNSLIDPSGIPRPVKIPLADFGTSYSNYTSL
jgi:hypothetical protein